MKKSYDFLVIGGGSAGYAAARTAHAQGLSTAVIDGAAELGGLCILRGCMPSKTLIESANRFRAMKRAAEFGLRADHLSVDTQQIITRKRRLIGEFASYRSGQLEDGRFDLYRGKASFDGEFSVSVVPIDGSESFGLGFKTAFIATGSSVTRPPIEGLEETGYWTSDELLEAETLPESMIVLGGGAIALEMACYLEGLGNQVTIIQRSAHVLSGSDADIANSLEGALKDRKNLTLFTGTAITRASREEETGLKTIFFQHEGEEKSVSAKEILLALGRTANTAGVNLSAARVVLDESSGKIFCGPDQRTSAGHIFAGGDVCGPHEIVHIAIEQGEIAAYNAAVLLGSETSPLRLIDYRLKLLGIFTDPQVATVGLSEVDAQKSGQEIAIATYPFDDHGKSIVRGETHGLVKMIADSRTGEILGAAVVGPEAVEIIHEVVVAMHFRSTAAEFLKIPHYHPTLSEIWTYPAEDLSFSS